MSLAISITGIVYTIATLAFGIITYRYYRLQREGTSAEKRILFLYFAFLTLICWTGAAAGSVFLRNPKGIFALLVASSLFVSFANALLIHLVFLRGGCRISPWWGSGILFVYGLVITIWTGLTTLHPVLEENGGLNWGMPVVIDLMGASVYFLATIPAIFLYIQQYRTTTDRVEKSETLFLILVFSLAALVVLTDFVVEPLLASPALLSEAILLLITVVGMLLYFWLNERSIRRSERQIRQSLQEREKLLQEVYHRTKNNMTVIISLLNMQNRELEQREISGVLKQVADRIHAMSLVHDQLYRSEDLSTINLDAYVQMLIHHLHSSLLQEPGRVRIDCEGEPILLGLPQAVPLGLVLNEILTNAFKHAFPAGRSGTIRVRIGADERESVAVEIGDNGVGLPPSLQGDENSMGRKLIRMLVEDQLQGRLEGKFDQGVQFSIAFPRQNP